ncbi:hypothetical protein QWY16_09505 [Planococcus shenhongbingii]|uniref:hypothetical protein n=1 Tax=Planococcus shenhongbingii TaxID=3058398 RepID=UPI00261577A8|nr:hypothetical protein [Planococcus sp. N016]WKA60318.1 hypothetical protein QWY16_09505 [Planococcus sp. N016]
MLVVLGIMDFILVVMHYTDYVLLFFKPTGYVIPLVLNIVIINVIVFKSKLSKGWATAILFIGLPILLFHGFIVLWLDNNYTKIVAPDNQQSLVIEYRHATLGETTYFYDFYETKFGFIGKHLDDQSITLIVRDHSSGIDPEGILGLGKEEWITANTVRFSTWQGMKDVYLRSSQPSFEMEERCGMYISKEKPSLINWRMIAAKEISFISTSWSGVVFVSYGTGNKNSYRSSRFSKSLFV